MSTRRDRTVGELLMESSGGSSLVIKNTWGFNILDEEEGEDFCPGRHGPDAVDENQSPVVWHPDYSPTPTWRGKREKDCIPGTWMPEYDATLVEDAKRGEVLVGCPEKELFGSRGHGSMNGRVTTYMNNLEIGPMYTYRGLAGNPSRARGVGPMGSTDGTAEYGGGSLTTAFNSPIHGRCGQQLYFTEYPYVRRDKATRKVLGNHYHYNGYGQDRHGYQPKLLPMLIVMDAENLEHLYRGPLWDFTDTLQDLLLPGKVASSSSRIAEFDRNVIMADLILHGLQRVPHISLWMRIHVLADGLLTAFFQWKGGKTPNSYEAATKTLYTQTLHVVNQFFKDEHLRALQKFGSYDHPMAQKVLERMPMLDPNQHLDKAGPEDPETGLKHEWHLVWKLLRKAQFVLVCLMTYNHAWMKAHWLGTITSPVANPRGQVKLWINKRTHTHALCCCSVHFTDIPYLCVLVFSISRA
jgi:hypothetical protein